MMSKNRSVWMTCLSAGMALSLAGLTLGQTQPEKKPAAQPTHAPAKAEQPKDAKGGQPALDPEMAKMMAAAEPGENHKLLSKFEGEWSGTVKMWQAPGQTPTESTTTAHHKMVLGGRYVHSHFEGDFQGMKFEGMGVMGYNNVLKTFQSGWVDNMGTGVERMTGTYDAATKAFTFTGDMTCPMTGGTMKMRDVIKWTGENTYVEEMYGPGPDGKDFKMMEISVKRGAAKSEAEKHEGKGKDKDK